MGGVKMNIPKILDPGDSSLSIVVFNLERKIELKNIRRTFISITCCAKGYVANKTDNLKSFLSGNDNGNFNIITLRKSYFFIVLT